MDKSDGLKHFSSIKDDTGIDVDVGIDIGCDVDIANAKNQSQSPNQSSKPDSSSSYRYSYKSASKSKYSLILDRFLSNVRRKMSIADFKQRLSTCERSSDRINLVNEHFTWTPSHPLLTNDYRKNRVTSSEFRNGGNVAYERKGFVEAVKSYNMALLFAIPGQPEVGLAYANRSAALHYLGDTEGALRDIELALENNYPTEQPDKCRKLQERKLRYEEHLQRRALFHQQEEHLKDETNRRNSFYEDMFTLKHPNTMAPSLEDSVEIRFNSQRGRHIVATTDIPIGTTVLVETPFVACLDNVLNFDVEHCHHCLKRNFACIPCPNCIFALYCDDKCRSEAKQMYHRFECPCLPELHCLLKDDRLLKHFYLVFRLICIVGPHELFSIFSEQSQHEATEQVQSCRGNSYSQFSSVPKLISGCDPHTGIYSPDSYNAIYHLMPMPSNTISDNNLNQINLNINMNNDSSHIFNSGLNLNCEAHSNSNSNFESNSASAPIPNLNSNSKSSAKSENEDYNDSNLVLILMCLILSQILSLHSNFFLEIFPCELLLSKTKTKAAKFHEFIAQLILHHFQNFQRHIFELHEFTNKEGGLINLRSFIDSIDSFGNPKELEFSFGGFSIGIFATLTLFNHSCDPSVTRFTGKSFGRTAVVTLKPVKRGEELLISYGPIYYGNSQDSGCANSNIIENRNRNSTKERQTTLFRGYDFKCDCIACQNDWPSPSDAQLQIQTDLIEQATFVCSFCSTKFKHEKKMSPRFLKCILVYHAMSWDSYKCGECNHSFSSRALYETLNEHMEVLETGRELILRNSPLQIIPSLKKAMAFFETHLCPPNYRCVLASQFYREAVDLVILFSQSDTDL